MRYPNFREEKKLHKKGRGIVVGVDEVGRGPLAGPVVACAFALLNFGSENYFMLDASLRQHGARSSPPKFPPGRDHAILSARQAKNNFPRSIFRDSKQLSEKQREEIFDAIKKCPDFVWAVGQVSEKMIDRINILEATKLAMQKAVKNLNKKIKKLISLKIDDSQFFTILLIDGNMKFDKNWFGVGCDYKSIVKGDRKVFSISTASIIAKVYRDKLMQKYAKKYPQYGFEIHKGYGTKKHIENLKKFGPCQIHRRSFLGSLE